MSALNLEQEEDWWKNAVIYQIYPRSFKDSNGDGVGDLIGINEQLSYLGDLGVTAIWLSPIYVSPMVDFGYDISDYKAIDSVFGIMEDFDCLMKEANRLGIKVILDFVPNHTSDQCEWFEKSVNMISPYKDFYVWADGKINKDGTREPPNNWLSVFYGSAWSWHKTRQQYYLHQFAKEQPDLNFRNPQVLQAIDEVLIFWLNKGVTGFRIDAIIHLFEDEKLRDEPLSFTTKDETSHQYLKHIYTTDLPEVYDVVNHWRQMLDSYSSKYGGPQRILMAEAFTDVKHIMDYYETATGKLGAHIPFNFFIMTDLDKNSDARDFVLTLQKWMIYMPRGLVANWVLGNHDHKRIAERFGKELVDVMNMLLLTLPGVAVTYYGEEIGMENNNEISWEDTVDPPALQVGRQNYLKVSRDSARTPFQWSGEKNAGFSTASKTWLPVNRNYIDLNLEVQKKQVKSHYRIYKALVALRRLAVLRKGKSNFVVVNRYVFILKRELKGHDSVITVINLGSDPQSLNLKEFFGANSNLEVLVSSSVASYENGDRMSGNTSLTLKSKDGLVGRLFN